MIQNPNGGLYDLEERTYVFAKDIALFCKSLPRIQANIIYCNQLIRSAGSTGANYIEANESLGLKDFKMKIKICRKEAKESAYWLRLIMSVNDPSGSKEATRLYNEAIELKKIF